jgi:hypothetical protein
MNILLSSHIRNFQNNNLCLRNRSVGFRQTLKYQQNLIPSILRKITNELQTLRKYLNIPFSRDHAVTSYNHFHQQLQPRPNP